MAGWIACRRGNLLGLLVALALGGAGCLGYSFSGRTRTGDVYIPFFEDQSSGEHAVNAGLDLTQRVLAEFQSDRSTRVFQAANERSRASKELLGTVRRVTESLLSRDASERGEEYRVIVTCSVTYRDLATDKILWQNAGVTGDGQYELAQGEDGYRQALDEALDDIVRIITDNTLRAW